MVTINGDLGRVVSIQYDPVKGTVDLVFDYNQDIQDEELTLDFDPGLGNSTALQSKTVSSVKFTVNPENNLQANYY
jgi:hypothetical protein